jgi:hypothetical protein
MTEREPVFEAIADEEDAMRRRSGARERLLARIDALPKASATPRRRGLTLGLAAALLAVFLAAGSWYASSGRALEVRVGRSSTPALVDAWLGAPDDALLPLEFSDGTRVELSPGTRARLREVRTNGARIELDGGRMHVHVVPRKGARFQLDVGPFGVQVTGTRFDVSYAKHEDRFELSLEEGEVVLSGCVFGDGRKLAPGQTVRASCQRSSLEVSYGKPTAVTSATPNEARAAPLPPIAAPIPERTRDPAVLLSAAKNALSAPPERRPSAEAAWLPLARRGAFREALSAAEASGFEASARVANAEDLLLLADAARHAGSGKRAVEALGVLRSRFPGSPSAALSAFKLGRIEFDANRAYLRAAEWFKTYLREQPGGPVTREALGRVLESFDRAGQPARAKEFAVRYLREYSSGPHAELAARIATSP